MKKKLFYVLLTAVITLSACGSPATTPTTTQATTTETPTTTAAPETTTEAPTTTPETTTAAPETTTEAPTTTVAPESGAEIENGINFSVESGSLVYKKHEITEDYQGGPALLIYFDYTNNSNDASSAIFSFNVKPFQGGIECSTAILSKAPQEYSDSMTEIKSGATLPVAFAYKLRDTTSDVEIEVSELISFDGNKATQILKLQGN